jgi:hypothetical protein
VRSAFRLFIKDPSHLTNGQLVQSMHVPEDVVLKSRDKLNDALMDLYYPADLTQAYSPAFGLAVWDEMKEKFTKRLPSDSSSSKGRNSPYPYSHLYVYVYVYVYVYSCPVDSGQRHNTQTPQQHFFINKNIYPVSIMVLFNDYFTDFTDFKKMCQSSRTML